MADRSTWETCRQALATPASQAASLTDHILPLGESQHNVWFESAETKRKKTRSAPKVARCKSGGTLGNSAAQVHKQYCRSGLPLRRTGFESSLRSKSLVGH